jgi:hypothetical protein
LVRAGLVSVVVDADSADSASERVIDGAVKSLGLLALSGDWVANASDTSGLVVSIVVRAEDRSVDTLSSLRVASSSGARVGSRAVEAVDGVENTKRVSVVVDALLDRAGGVSRASDWGVAASWVSVDQSAGVSGARISVITNTSSNDFALTSCWVAKVLSASSRRKIAWADNRVGWCADAMSILNCRNKGGAFVCGVANNWDGHALSVQASNWAARIGCDAGGWRAIASWNRNVLASSSGDVANVLGANISVITVDRSWDTSSGWVAS